MPDYSAPNSLPDFAAAAKEPATPQAIVTVQLDADVLDWFQKNQPDGMTWQQDMNSVLRYHMDSIEAMDRAAELEPLTPGETAYGLARQAAMDELTERHQGEYDDVHNGSGRSEEMPSDLERRHREEWRAFEQSWPEQQGAVTRARAPDAEPDYIPF